MPEGDTLYRIASVLTRAIGGKVIQRVRSPIPEIANAALEGRTVARVEAQGKHLLIHFDDGRVLRSHLRMTGSWHIYRPGERWQKPERWARVALDAGDIEAVCFSAPEVELLRPAEVAHHPALSRLGPDVLKEDFDAAEARRRLRERGDAPIGDALLAQQALAGIGNVYKSEVLFRCRTSPFKKVAELGDAELDALIAEARALMTRNLGGAPRTTRFSGAGPRYWVYRRSGRPCLTCGALIRMQRQGLAARSTYYCPRCQGCGESG